MSDDAAEGFSEQQGEGGRIAEGGDAGGGAGYAEFGMFADNASEVGLPYDGPPDVKRVEVAVTHDGRRLSALVWGPGEPEVVLLHGGAQNAHTWDTVALALGRPLVAIDLPGHGHSDWKADHAYWPPLMADDVAVAVQELAPDAELVVGMSLGGMTAFCLAAQHPELVRRLAIVDVTPGVNHEKAEPILSFVSGPETFASFDEILERTIQFNPTRTESSLRRGVLHNAKELPDGSWTWRYDVMRDWAMEPGADPDDPMPAFDDLWHKVDAVQAPLLLLRGADSGVVDDDDVAELLRRQPDAEVVVVEGAGHSIQGDQPVELARLLDSFLSRK
jgi:pimeloyl-ACP methyl ester carboxylesterase